MFKGFILCDKRTGSTLLQNCLDSHPEITCYDELFMIRGKIKKRNGQYMYRWMKNNKSYNKKKFLNYLGEQDENVYLKLIYDQCDYWKLEPYIRKNNLQVIHLFRKNHFKKAVSRLSRNNNKGQIDPITNIDVKKLVNEILHSMEKSRIYKKKWEKYENQIKIYYEDMIGKKEGEIGEIKKVGAFNIKSNQITYLNKETCEKLCNFIGVEYFDMYSNITKRNKEDVLSYFNDREKRKMISLLKKVDLGECLDKWGIT